MKIRYLFVAVVLLAAVAAAGVFSVARAQEATPTPTDHASHHPADSMPAAAATETITETVTETITETQPAMGDMMGSQGAMDMGAMHSSMMDMIGDMDKMMSMDVSPELKAEMEAMHGRMDAMMNDMMGGSSTSNMGAMMEEMQAMQDMMGKMMSMDMSPAMKTRMEAMHGKMDAMMSDMTGGMPMDNGAMPQGGQSDHAAHHPDNQAAAGADKGGMGMMDMGAMKDMHAQMQGMMEDMKGMQMSPDMKSMMDQMQGMMDDMMKDMPMDGMAGADKGGMGMMDMDAMMDMHTQMRGMMDDMKSMMDQMKGMMGNMTKNMPMEGMAGADKGGMGMMDMDATMAMHVRMQGMMDEMKGMEMSPEMKSMMDQMQGMMSEMMKDMPMGDMAGMDHGGHNMAPIPSEGVPAATESTGGQPLEFSLEDGVKVFELTARPVIWNITDNVTATAWSYNGTVPGPMIRVTEGDKLRIIFKNELPEATTIHWHGIDVPNAYDGVPGMPTPSIQPGETFTYEFTVKTPGSFMYHSHMEGDKQVSIGLYAPFIIDPATPPAEPPAVDASLMLSEWRVVNGQTYAAMPMGGAEPNYFTINGKAYPATETINAKVGDRIRLRLMGIGQFMHPIHVHGAAFKIVATDGHPVPEGAQLTKDTVAVAPGERYDIEFEFTEPGMWMVHCHILHHTTNDGAEGGGMMFTIDVTE